ncbi:hypothetical protein BDV97DRAFT_402103 [Delphinella strobiligena]|nr:hypothetical protein BDV97DRAFT_402103 [Delphinella strobiligena]
MSRAFSSTARSLVQWLDFAREKLPSTWQTATTKFACPGGGAEQRLGKVESVVIKSRAEGPIHQSHFNRADKKLVISARIKGSLGTKTCHIYEDGTGTTKKGEDPR